MSDSVWAAGTEVQPVVRTTEAADFTFESSAGPTYYLPITSYPEPEELFVDIDGLRQFKDENFGYVKAERKITFTEALPAGLKVHVRVQATGVVSLPDQIVDPTPFGNALISQPDAAAARTTLELGNAALRNVGSTATTVAQGDHVHDGRYSLANHNHNTIYEPAFAAATANPEGKFLNGNKEFKQVPGYITGVLAGCEFSATPGTAVFTISSGKLQFCNEYTTPGDTSVSAVNFSGVVNAADAYPADAVTYVGVDYNLQVVQQTFPFNDGQCRYIAQIGALAKSAGLIIASSTMHNTAYNSPQFVGDLYRAIGPIATGLVYSGNAGLTLARTSGTLFRTGAIYNTDKVTPHTAYFTAQSPVTFSTYCRNNANNIFTGSGLVTTFNPAVYDAGGAAAAGVPAGVVSNNDWQAVRIFITTSGNSLLQYGQTVYNSLLAAQAGVQNETHYAARITKSTSFRGFLFVRGGATALNNANDAVFVAASKFGEVNNAASSGSGSSFDGNLNANLNIIGASRRITADFSNGTLAQRTLFQTSTVNGTTSIGTIPNGTSNVSALMAFGGPYPDNAQRLQLRCTGGVEAGILSTYSGTPASGTYLPLRFYTSAAIRQEILASGEVGIGVTPVAGRGALQIPDVNGSASSGFKNKVINGCMRISRKGSGAAVLGINNLGADGITTTIGGWSAISGWTITQASDGQDARTSSGSLHFCALGTVTGASGYIVYSHKIEAADTQEFAGRVVTLSCRLTTWGTPLSNYYVRIYKANAKNNFSAQTLVVQSPDYGALPINTVAQVAFTTTLAAADCMNGLQVEVISVYTGAVGASSYNFCGDLALRAIGQYEPFELRPIAVEAALRERYYKVLQLWVPTSSSRATAEISMHKTPTISGGGTGFTSTGTDKDNLVCYQTTAALQTIILNAELS
jgi:hypothetical protein